MSIKCTRRVMAGVLATGLAAAAGLAAPVAPAAAQERVRESGRITGIVVGTDRDAGVAGVAVRLLPPLDVVVLTSELGRFAFDAVPAGVHEVEVSHIGYGTRRERVNVPAGRTVELRIEVAAAAIEAGSIRVRVTLRNRGLERNGFYDRRRTGFGRFFDQRALEGRPLTSALREVPRLRLVGRGGFSHTPMFARGAGSCAPTVWIDRRPIRLQGWSIQELVDERDIAAMEVYTPGNTPGRFMGFGIDCGAIVIWTRGMNPG